MNLQYLGDAYDHWKGSIFECLQQRGTLNYFKVDRMATDVFAWPDADSELYAKLLRIGNEQLVTHEWVNNHNPLRQVRATYFDQIPRTGDLFLDPDTGIKTNGDHELEKYLQPHELTNAIDTEKNRIVVVYQHCRGNINQRVSYILTVLRRQPNPLVCLSYASTLAALLFFSQSRERLESVKNCFQLHGTHAADRIFFA